MNAASKAKKPPAFMIFVLGMSMASWWRYEMPSSMKAMSREKNKVKKATVERRVQSTRMKVKMNQPCVRRRRSVSEPPGSVFGRRRRRRPP